MKVLSLPHFMRLVLLLATACAFHACIDNKYDLDKDLSLEVNVGGKHLAIPLGSTSNIYLDSLVDAKDGDVLNFLENGDFALSKTDSLDIKIPKIDPVNITVQGLEIDPILVAVNNVQLPENFDLGNFSKNVSLGIGNIDLSVESMQPIQVTKNKPLPDIQPGTPLPPSISVTLEDDEDFNFSFGKPDEIKAIKAIYFGEPDKGTPANITLGLPASISSGNHIIEELSITMPEGFVLREDPQNNTGGIVRGNTFSLTNYNPQNQKTLVFSFYILKMSGNFSPDDTRHSYSGQMHYAVKYRVNNGQLDGSGDEAKINLDIHIPLSFRSADVATDDIPVSLSEQNIDISSSIKDIPEEIASVKTVYFDETANEIDINISALQLPVELSGNNLQLRFPASFHFQPSDGLSAGNILNISPAELDAGAIRKLHLKSIDLNQEVQNQEITLSENIVLQSASLRLNGSENVNTGDLSELSGKQIGITVSGESLKISHSSVTTKGVTVDIDHASTDMDISEKTPKELIAVQDVKFTQNPEVRVHLAFDGLPSSVEKLRLKGYTITFPDFIVFEGNEVQNHKLVLNEEFNVSGGFTKILKIEKFSFGDQNPISNEYITIHDSITLGGQLFIKESDLGSDELANITIRPQISIDPMELGVVTGKIDPEIDPEQEMVDIGDIPDFMKDDSVVLDIMHPLITVNASNTIGVPVRADLTMTPELNNKPISSGVINASIAVSPALIPGQPAWSNFWISDTQEGMPASYTYVATPNLPNLIRKVPDSIAIVVNAAVNPDVLHSVDLSVPEYKLQVVYNISVPIKLGKDLNIIYHDTIDDFHSDIKDYVDYVTEVQMFTEIDNTIPLEMTCSALAIDVDKRVLKGITVSAPQKVTPAGWDSRTGQTTLSHTSFPLVLHETVKGEMSKLDGIVFKISAKANSTVAGATLKRDQYLKISAKMKVPGGITVDIDDL